eukprot:6146661-Prymnesium_polylepis.1
MMVVDWLLPVVSSILREVDMECEPDVIKDACSLRWCAMAQVGRLRSRKEQEPDKYKDRIEKLASKVLEAANNTSSDELDSDL